MKRPDQLTTTAEQRIELRRLLSGCRMRSYAAAAADGSCDELNLYVYNMALASALLGPLHILEVATRNAIHERFVAQTGRRDWWNAPAVAPHLRGWAGDQVRSATAKIRSRRGPGGPPVTPDDVVAATEFGFWTDLLRPSYERTLWQSTVRLAFPNSRRSRHQLFQALQSHRRLRNRVTHHEPLHAVDAVAEYDAILRSIGFISRPVAQWVDDRSRLGVVALARPGRVPRPVAHF